VVDLDLSTHRWREPARAAALVSSLLERVAALPGVRAAGASETLPLRGPEQESDFRLIGHPEPTPADRPTAMYGAVTPGYFAAMRIPLRRGRGVAATDGDATERVAVVNEALARRWFPGEDPIGKRIAISVEALRFDRPDRPPRLDFPGAARVIVGVVGDVRHVGLTDASRPEIFLPNAQRPARRMSVVVRTTGDPLALAGAVRVALHELAPDQPVTAISTMSLRVAETLGAPRARAGLVSLLAVVALTLAAVATYGVVAYGVATRRRELGVRIALGARRIDVARLVMGQGGRLTAAGIALGLVGAWLGARALGGLVYGVGVRDAVTFAVVPCVIAAVALLASWLPARRAASIDPATTLRAE
jgi:predicted permease